MAGERTQSSCPLFLCGSLAQPEILPLFYNMFILLFYMSFLLNFQTYSSTITLSWWLCFKLKKKKKQHKKEKSRLILPSYLPTTCICVHKLCLSSRFVRMNFLLSHDQLLQLCFKSQYCHPLKEITPVIILLSLACSIFPLH